MEDELDAVLGTDAQAAVARNRFKIDIPPERRTAGGRIVDRGGLWFAYMQSSDWYTTVQTAVTTPADAFFQFGIAFQVTHKATECFGRVSFGPPYGLTPDWAPYKDLAQLRNCPALCETPVREPAPDLISSKSEHKKACRAFGTMFPPCYGTEVKRQWDVLLDRIFALAEQKKWILASIRRFVGMCLCDFTTRVRGSSIDLEVLHEGSTADEWPRWCGTEMADLHGSNGTTVRPNFSIILRHATSMARINEGAVRGLIAQLGLGRKRAISVRTQQHSGCKTAVTVTAKHCLYPSGQLRLVSEGAEAAAADLLMRRTLEFAKRPRRERATLAQTQQS